MRAAGVDGSADGSVTVGPVNEDVHADAGASVGKRHLLGKPLSFVSKHAPSHQQWHISSQDENVQVYRLLPCLWSAMTMVLYLKL